MIPGIFLTFWAQSRLKEPTESILRCSPLWGMSGAQVAQTILSKKGIGHIRIEPVAGELTDHYDPGAKARTPYPQGIYGSSSLAAAAGGSPRMRPCYCRM